MRKFGLLFFFCCFFFTEAQKALAQEAYTVDVSEYQGKGDAISSVDSSKKYFLYNVGMDMFLNAGGYWGTQAVVFTVGLPVTIASYNGGYTINGPFNNETDSGAGKYLGYVSNTNAADQGFFWDRSIDSWTFTQVSYDDDDGYIYTLKNKNKYMYAGTDLLDGNLYGTPKTGVSYADSYDGDKCYQWKIVSEEDIIENFKNTYDNDVAADATFLVRAQNFNRTNIYNDKEEITDSNPLTAGNGWYLSKVSGSSLEYTCNADTAGFPGTPLKEDALRKFGQYVVGCMTNGTAGDELVQKVEIPKRGWYRVTCQGFYHNGTDNSAPLAELFARISGTGRFSSSTSTYAYVNLASKESKTTDGNTYFNSEGYNVGTIGSMKDAGMVFFYNTFPSSVMIYVSDSDGEEDLSDTYIEIGIRVTADMESDDYVCFDDFELKFVGEEVVLSENDVSINPNDDSNDYENRVVLFERKFTLGKWNTITLPFDMTKSQFRTAFKSTAQLAEFRGFADGSNTMLCFQIVDIVSKADTARVMEKDRNYIIYIEDGGYNETYYANTSKQTSPINYYYTIPRVSLNKEKLQEEIDARTNGHHVNMRSDGDVEYFENKTGCRVAFYGTHTRLGNEGDTDNVPANAYVFSGGNIYYTSKNMSVSGFRSWLQDDHAEASARHMLGVSLNGVEDNTTQIVGLFCDEEKAMDGDSVHDISGRLVRGGTTSLEGLAKGIYIVNGKKYIVK